MSLDIETPSDAAFLEDHMLGTTAELFYFNTIRNELRTVSSGERKPPTGSATLTTSPFLDSQRLRVA